MQKVVRITIDIDEADNWIVAWSRADGVEQEYDSGEGMEALAAVVAHPNFTAMVGAVRRSL